MAPTVIRADGLVTFVMDNSGKDSTTANDNDTAVLYNPITVTTYTTPIIKTDPTTTTTTTTVLKSNDTIIATYRASLEAIIKKLPYKLPITYLTMQSDYKWLANSLGTYFNNNVWYSKHKTNVEIPNWYSLMVPEFIECAKIEHPSGDSPSFIADAFIYDIAAPVDILETMHEYNPTKSYYDYALLDDGTYAPKLLDYLEYTNIATPLSTRPFYGLWALTTGSPYNYFGLPIVDLSSIDAAIKVANTAVDSNGEAIKGIGYKIVPRGRANPFFGRHHWFYATQRYAELIWRPTIVRISWEPAVAIYFDSYEAFGRPEQYRRNSSNTRGIALTGGHAEINLSYLIRDLSNIEYNVGKLSHFDIRANSIFTITQFDVFGLNPLDYSYNVDPNFEYNITFLPTYYRYYEAMPFSQDYVGRGTESGLLNIVFYPPEGTPDDATVYYIVDPDNYPTSTLDTSWSIAPFIEYDNSIPFSYGITVRIPPYDPSGKSKVVVGFYAVSKNDPNKVTLPIYREYRYSSFGITPPKVELDLTDDKGETFYV